MVGMMDALVRTPWRKQAIVAATVSASQPKSSALMMTRSKAALGSALVAPDATQCLLRGPGRHGPGRRVDVQGLETPLREVGRLEDDPVFVHGLEHGVSEARATVKEPASNHIEEEELQHGTQRRAVEEPLLVVAPDVVVGRSQRLQQTEPDLGPAVSKGLLSLEGAVPVVPVDPLV